VDPGAAAAAPAKCVRIVSNLRLKGLLALGFFSLSLTKGHICGSKKPYTKNSNTFVVPIGKEMDLCLDGSLFACPPFCLLTPPSLPFPSLPLSLPLHHPPQKKT